MKHGLLAILFLTTMTVRAQTVSRADTVRVNPSPSPVAKAHAHYDGIVSLSTNGKYAFFCLGGPSIGITKGHWRIAANLYPSLRIGRPEGSPSPRITPTLGTGVYLSYRRVLLLVPFHYISEQRKWTANVGLGWRVSK